MSTITITIQRFFFSCCCSFFFFLFHPCYFINCCRNFFLSPYLPCLPRLYSSIYPSIIWSLLRRSTPHSTPHTHSRLVSGMYFFVMTSWKGQFIKKIWTVFLSSSRELSSSRRTKNELRFYTTSATWNTNSPKMLYFYTCDRHCHRHCLQVFLSTTISRIDPSIFLNGFMSFRQTFNCLVSLFFVSFFVFVFFSLPHSLSSYQIRSCSCPVPVCPVL